MRAVWENQRSSAGNFGYIETHGILTRHSKLEISRTDYANSRRAKYHNAKLLNFNYILYIIDTLLRNYYCQEKNSYSSVAQQISLFITACDTALSLYRIIKSRHLSAILKLNFLKSFFHYFNFCKPPLGCVQKHHPHGCARVSFYFLLFVRRKDRITF